MRVSAALLHPGARSSAASACSASAPTSATYAGTSTAHPFTHAAAAYASSASPNSDRIRSAFPCWCGAQRRLWRCTYSPMKASRVGSI